MTAIWTSGVQSVTCQDYANDLFCWVMFSRGLRQDMESIQALSLAMWSSIVCLRLTENRYYIPTGIHTKTIGHSRTEMP